MEIRTKGAIASVILILLTAAAAATLITATGYGENPIEVRYEDGTPPVDKVYTHTDGVRHDVKIECPDHGITVYGTVVAYEGQEVTDEVKEELREIICGALEETNE